MEVDQIFVSQSEICSRLYWVCSCGSIACRRWDALGSVNASVCKNEPKHAAAQAGTAQHEIQDDELKRRGTVDAITPRSL